MISSNCLIFDIKRFAISDGPEIRTTIFFKGCPLKCPWCHNPEGISFRQEFFWRRTKCSECNECIRICPHGYDPKDVKRLNEKFEECLNCRKCVDICPTGAITIIGKEIELADLIELISRDIDYYADSGGVTFSGGEPLAHMSYLQRALEECKRIGVNTCIETSGFCSKEDLLLIIDYVDFFMFDLKLANKEESQRVIGANIDKIVENLNIITSEKKCVLRLPMIRDLTDTKENIELLLAILRQIPNKKNLSRVELLPYHKLGESKYICLGKETLKVFEPSTESNLNCIKEKISSLNYNVSIERF
ncbi:MAG: hypothetical protein A2Y10_07035 [Planctomycetes bacterium GWF2_41_51]|nr:MAG: hypothetical protein A2Y10_07035 [Planctomycetes bacterium GWF2_41_51]HBG28781.1 glycyl-radical enzyme activating protein [Phycisphaerales bacterium]